MTQQGQTIRPKNIRIPEDTIAGISTPPGEGAIGIVRLSGPRAISITSSVFRSSHGRDIVSDGRQVFHGRDTADDK